MGETNKSSIYDEVVIGGGLSGLLIATALSRAGRKVLLVDESDHLGGTNHAVLSPFGEVNNGLRFLPYSDQTLQAMEVLGKFIDLPEVQKIERPALEYREGGLKSFLGFEDQQPDFYDEYSYFLAPYRLSLKAQPSVWVQSLAQQFQASESDLALRSEVTQLVCEDQQISHIVINGQKQIVGQRYILACNPKKLLQLTKPELITGKTRQKLAKAELATALCLDLFHKTEIDQDDSVVLLGGFSEKPIYCLGQFHKTANGQYSQWLTWIKDQEAEDSEAVGAALRLMKKQIKRAFPQLFEALEFERVFVAGSMGGTIDLKLTQGLSFPGIGNLIMASNLFDSSCQNLVGSIVKGQEIISLILGRNINQNAVQQPKAQDLDPKKEELSIGPSGAEAEL